MDKDLNSEENYNRVKKMLKGEKTIMLSTVDGEYKQGRLVYYVFYKNSVYFITKITSNKYKQIKINPIVTFSIIDDSETALDLNDSFESPDTNIVDDNYISTEMEGIAIIKGHTQSEENKKLFEYCSKKCQEMDDLGKHKNSVLIEIKIKKIEMWKGQCKVFEKLNKV